jgi:hypothetical protein
MPLIARVFIKSGFIFFALALLTGVLSESGLFSTAALMPLFWHMLTVGWITQIIIGVSLWMFPGRPKTDDIKSNATGWITWIALNSGLVLRFTTEPFVYSVSSGWISHILVLSAILQLLAAIVYVYEMWFRVASPKQRMKQKRNERRS